MASATQQAIIVHRANYIRTVLVPALLAAVRAELDERLPAPHLDGIGATIGAGGTPLQTTAISAANAAIITATSDITTAIAAL